MAKRFIHAEIGERIFSHLLINTWLSFDLVERIIAIEARDELRLIDFYHEKNDTPNVIQAFFVFSPVSDYDLQLLKYYNHRFAW